MSARFLTRWFRSLVSVPRTIRKANFRKGFRPNLETLEDLVLPSTVTFFPTYLESTAHAVKPQLGGGGPTGMSPAQIQQAYGFNQITFQSGSSSVVGTGAGETIAIVDAYDNPNMANDLATFDSQFGLAAPASFTKVGISSSGAASTTNMPAANSGWAGEISLDVEWAHAIAPAANILLVEANSASSSDLLNAIDYARSQKGVVAVSMSWGSSEFSGETSWDSHFVSNTTQGITFLGSSGDSGSPSIWPALSSRVIGVGGTSLTLGANGTYSSETAWSGSGGSLSSYASAPTYQSGLTIHSGSSVISANNERAGPDVSFDADPNTGVAVYSQYGFGGWAQVGGTSDAAPQWAGLIAIADQGLALAGKGSLDGASQTLPDLYKLPSSDFHDIMSGSNGGYSAGVGFDLVTGLGTPNASLVVAGLVSLGTTGGTGGGTGGGGTVPSQPPSLTTPTFHLNASGTSGSLSVTGSETSLSASQLIYTWQEVSGPAAVTFSANGTSSANNTTVTFTALSTSSTPYVFKVTVSDPSSHTATANVNGAVTAVATSVVVTPANVTLAPGSTQQFSAVVDDQFGTALVTQPAIVWSLGANSVGAINSSGLYSVASAITGNASVIATTGSLSATATVTVASSTTLFSDNFENGTRNWTVTSGNYDYYLQNVNGNHRLMVVNDGFDTSRIVAGQTNWTNYSFQGTLSVAPGSSGSASLLARVQDSTHLYFFGYNVALGEWMIALRNGSTVTILSTSAPTAIQYNQNYTVQANLNGSSLSLAVNGTVVTSVTDSTFSKGQIGFSATNAIAYLDNVVVTSITSPNVVLPKTVALNPATPSNPVASWSVNAEGYYSNVVAYLMQSQHGSWWNTPSFFWD